MIFDKSTVIDGMKLGMEPNDRAKIKDHELALILCLDDLSTKMKSKSLLMTYDVTIAATDRTKNLSGENNDLKYIFAIKYGTGSDQRVLEYVDPTKFLKNYDDPAAIADTPTKFTQLTSSDGYPTIKFNIPAKTSTTITVYYYPDITPENISQGRSAAVMVAGGKAYFYGLDSERGMVNYAAYKELVGGARAADEFLTDTGSRFEMSQDDMQIRGVAWNIKDRRSG